MHECNGGESSESRERAIFRLFTDFHAQSAERGSVVLASALGESLAAYLLLNRGQPVSRVRIVRLLWPDLPEVDGRRRLSKLLWRLRAQGIESVLPIVAADGHLQVDPAADLVIDVEAFRSGIEAIRANQIDAGSGVSIADLEAVARMYRGPLLEHNEAEWLVAERQNLAQQFTSLLRGLIRLCREQGDLDGALTWARRLLEAEPLVEEHHQEIIRLCILQNRASEARAQFESCRQMLRFEFDAPPSTESLTLLGEIERTRADHDGVQGMQIVGRQKARGQLADQLDGCAAGRSGVALIKGEPGFGKTVLLDELTARARNSGMSVIFVEHTERSAAKAYGGLAWSLSNSLRGVHGEHVAETLDNRWVASAARVIPGLSAAADLPALRPGGEETWRQHEALAQVVLAHGRVRPTLLVLDDLHWADDDTMSVLRHVVRQLDSTKLLVAAAYRNHEATQRNLNADKLAQVGATIDAVVHHLAPLGFLESAELVESVDSNLDSASVDWLIAQTGGNPFFLVETVRVMAGVDPAKRSGPGHEPLVAASISEVITKRFQALSTEARNVATALAVLGRPVAIVDLCQLMSSDVHVLGPSLEELASAGFTDEVGAAFSLRHDQVRSTIISIAELDQRRMLHQAATGVLLSASELDDPIPWDEVAHHARCSEQWSIAAEAAHLAARAAADVHANDLAAEDLEAALEAHRNMDPSTADPKTRIDVLFELEMILELLGERERQAAVLAELLEASRVSPSLVDPRRLAERRALHLADIGLPHEALDVIATALDAASDVDDTSLRVLRGTILNRSGAGKGAVTVLEDAVRDLLLRGEQTAPTRCELGSTLSELQDYASARRHLDLALLESSERGEIRTQIEALGGLARIDSVQGHFDEAESKFIAATERSQLIGYHRGVGLSWVNRGTMHAISGRGGLALNAYREARAVFASISEQRGMAFVLANEADVRCWLLGDLEGAERLAGEALAIFRSQDDTSHESMGLDVLANVARMRRRFTACRRHLSRATSVAVDNQFLTVQAMSTLARVEMDQDRFRQGLVVTNDALSICKEIGLETLTPFILALEARSLDGLGEPGPAADVAMKTAKMVNQGQTLPHVVLLWCAEVLENAGASDQASAIMEQAWTYLERALSGLGPTERHMALSNVPEHVAIHAAHQRMTKQLVEVRLPDVSAPTGRPVHSSEFVPVRWTIIDPSDFLLESRVERRRKQLTRLIGEAASQGGAPRLSDLGEAVGASAATIKRDLAHLRDLGYELATRGSHF